MKKLINEAKRMQQLAGLLNENEGMGDDTIEVDGMTGLYMTTVGQTKLYSSESTEVGSNFDYFIVTPGEEPKFISVELDEEPESAIKAKFVMKKTGLQDPMLCKAIAADMNQELDLM